MADEPEDLALVSAWRGGDASAGATLFRRHFSSIYRFFARRDPDAAKDLTQKTFLACSESKDRIRPDASVRAYLFGVAHNQLLMYLRKEDRKQRAYGRAAAGPPSIRTTPSQMAARQEEHKLLLASLRRLPLDLQLPLELYYWESLPTKEIAGILELPASTVTSRLARARERLRAEILDADADAHLQQNTVRNLDKWARSVRELLDD